MAMAGIGLAGCDQLALGPRDAAPAAPESTLDVSSLADHAGRTYADFAADPGAHGFSIDALLLTEGGQARFAQAMGAGRPSVIVSGGGARGLVFSGCGEDGCEAARAFLAIDLDTGEAFVGVSDETGRAVLSPNERMEALLRLNAPSRRWDRPVLPAPEEAP